MLPTATQPTPAGQVMQAPRERLTAFQQAPADAIATVVVTRDRGMFGIACYYAVLINETLAARLSAGETARFYLVPGTVQMKAVPDPQAKGLCSVGQGEGGAELRANLGPDETRRFRLHIDHRGALHILPE